LCEYKAAAAADDGTVNVEKGAAVRISIEYEAPTVHANSAAEWPRPPGNEPLQNKLVRVPIELLIHNVQTRKPMKQSPFIFTGSTMAADAAGKKILAADQLDLVVALKFDANALLNTPMNTRNFDPQKNPTYEISAYTVPKAGTKCRIIFEPWKNEIDPKKLDDTGVAVKPRPENDF
jgi:hypothetical protein